MNRLLKLLIAYFKSCVMPSSELTYTRLIYIKSHYTSKLAKFNRQRQAYITKANHRKFDLF